MMCPLISLGGGHYGHGFHDGRRSLVMLVFTESGRMITEIPWTGGYCGGCRGLERRSWRLVPIRGRGSCGGCGPVQKLNVLVELRMIRHCCGRGLFDTADERVDQERPRHGLLAIGRGHHYRRMTVVHFRPERSSVEKSNKTHTRKSDANNYRKNANNVFVETFRMNTQWKTCTITRTARTATTSVEVFGGSVTTINWRQVYFGTRDRACNTRVGGRPHRTIKAPPTVSSHRTLFFFPPALRGCL